ncbi:MAG TPA: carbohydrate-binding family 9-like protein, partial [Clostridia bacterium]|nr:carbohydrate-binding family 9-like protein [Clostridia bacterium]
MNISNLEMNYTVQRSPFTETLEANWNAPVWQAAPAAEITHFRPESSAHRPPTFVRLLHGEGRLHGIFQVKDRYVRCVRTRYFDEVWKDSCVEFFVQPRSDKGYFNFEFNCGGAHLCNYITDPTRVPGGFARAERLPAELGKLVRIKSSLPQVVDPEMAEPVEWSLEFSIPLAVLEAYTGPLGDVSGQSWRANFFKCAEEVSHPHWGAWSAVDEFNF